VTETRTIHVGALARVEGEGALHLRVENGRLVDLRLEIYEPPRFFEAFVRGRRAASCRICCRASAASSMAYQMGVPRSRRLGRALPRLLRRLYYAGGGSSHLLT
jgi:coenzyme F420-reducing hydrogenase alpha subunit